MRPGLNSDDKGDVPCFVQILRVGASKEALEKTQVILSSLLLLVLLFKFVFIQNAWDEGKPAIGEATEKVVSEVLVANDQCSCE